MVKIVSVSGLTEEQRSDDRDGSSIYGWTVPPILTQEEADTAASYTHQRRISRLNEARRKRVERTSPLQDSLGLE